jgi:hypothetical protein
VRKFKLQEYALIALVRAGGVTGVGPTDLKIKPTNTHGFVERFLMFKVFIWFCVV